MIDFSENMARSIAMLHFLVTAVFLVVGFFVLKYLVHVMLAALVVAVALYVLVSHVYIRRGLTKETSHDSKH